MTPQVGLFFVSFDKKLICTGIELPVYMSDRLARVVLPVFCKFDGKSVHGTLMETCDETFNNLLGNEFYVVILGDFRQIY